MKTDNFRRSDNVEDFRDPNRPAPEPSDAAFTISEVVKLGLSQLAKALGAGDVGKKQG